MKIAVVASGHIPSRWAHSINVVKHAQAFHQLGHDVELLTIDRYVEQKEKKEIKDVFDWYGVGKLKIKYFKDDSWNYWEEHSFLKWLVRLFNKVLPKIVLQQHPEKKISKYIQVNKFDLSYCRTFVSAIENIRNGVPTIVEIHSPEPEKNKQAVLLMEYAKDSCFLKLITIHERLRANFIALGVPKEKIIVLEDAVDLDAYEHVRANNVIKDIRLQLKLPLDRKIVGYTGHLYKGRGVDEIIGAAEKLKDIWFLIVGGTERDVRYYSEMISGRKIRNVILTGHVRNSEVPQYCIASDILIMPYTKDTPTWQHMSPIKMFEYLAAYKPIIATDLPAITKILEHERNALIVREKSVEDIVKAVQRLLKDQDFCKKVSENNKDKVKEYTYLKRCSKIVEGVVDV